MDNYEIFEEFKRKVINRLQYEEKMPQEMEKIVTQIFEELKNRYKNLQCSSLSIIEYIEGNLHYAKNEINKYLNENRKENQWQYIGAFMRNIEKELNEGSIKTKNVAMHQQEIEQMDSKDGQATERIENILGDFLRDIQSHQNRILDSRGYSMSQINDIQQETRGFINKSINQNEDKIYEILKRDSKQLKTWILEQYQDYVNQERIAQNKEKEKGKNEREEFMESLDAGISLEEQSQDAKERNEREVEENKNKEKDPNLSDFIEHLFD